MNKKILMLFGVSLLAFASIFGFYLFQNQDNDPGIFDTRVTNVTATSTTITWQSEDAFMGKVIVSETPDNFETDLTFYDDRNVTQNNNLDSEDFGNLLFDESKAKDRKTHHVTVTGLEPEKEYFFRIVNEEREFEGITFNENVISSFETTVIDDRPLRTPKPIYGEILNIDNEAILEDGIIYLTAANDTDQMNVSGVVINGEFTANYTLETDANFNVNIYTDNFAGNKQYIADDVSKSFILPLNLENKAINSSDQELEDVSVRGSVGRGEDNGSPQPTSPTISPIPQNNNGGSNDCTGKSCGPGGTCFTGDNPNDGGYGCACADGTTLEPSRNPGVCANNPPSSSVVPPNNNNPQPTQSVNEASNSNACISGGNTKSEGSGCNLNKCGNDACDGNGPLSCQQCPAGTRRAGQSFCATGGSIGSICGDIPNTTQGSSNAGPSNTDNSGPTSNQASCEQNGGEWKNNRCEFNNDSSPTGTSNTGACEGVSYSCNLSSGGSCSGQGTFSGNKDQANCNCGGSDKVEQFIIKCSNGNTSTTVVENQALVPTEPSSEQNQSDIVEGEVTEIEDESCPSGQACSSSDPSNQSIQFERSGDRCASGGVRRDCWTRVSDPQEEDDDTTDIQSNNNPTSRVAGETDNRLAQAVNNEEPLPEIIDFEDLEAGVYEISIPGYQTATLNVTGDKVTIEFFEDLNGNGEQDEGEPDLDIDSFDVSISKTKRVQRYDFDTGWNLIALNFVDEDLNTANQLVKELNDQGVDAVQVSKFDQGNWIHLAYGINDGSGEGKSFGADFQLVPGESYFVRTLSEGTARLTGNSFRSSVPITMELGWNLVSIQSRTRYTASSFLEFCSEEELDCTEFSRFTGNGYESVVERNDTFFGNDFNISNTEGYFIRNEDGEKIISP